MIGKIFVTSTGGDPEKGTHVKDPYLGEEPSLGACRPDIRAQLESGDHIFVVSGKVPETEQFVIGGFEIAEKISAAEAYERFPGQRLKELPDGQVTGNIIIGADGKQHPLDHHKDHERRLANYVVGRSPIALVTPAEVVEGRRRTLEILRDVFGTKGNSIRKVMGRWRNLSEEQILKLRAYLEEIKKAARPPMPVKARRKSRAVAR